MSNISRFID